MNRGSAATPLTYLREKLATMENGVMKGARYRLVARGELDERFAYLFSGMQMERVEGMTVLTGVVLYQAQLHGFI